MNRLRFRKLRCGKQMTEDQSFVMRISDCGLRNLKDREPKTGHGDQIDDF
jgi:hypothetical protein